MSKQPYAQLWEWLKATRNTKDATAYTAAAGGQGVIAYFPEFAGKLQIGIFSRSSRGHRAIAPIKASRVS